MRKKRYSRFWNCWVFVNLLGSARVTVPEKHCEKTCVEFQQNWRKRKVTNGWTTSHFYECPN